MDRRDLLRSLGALTIPALLGRTPEDLLDIGQRLNDRLTGSPRPTGPLGPFTAHQNEVVTTIAEHILPRTDTPGARDARVNEFIAVIVEEWYTDEERTRFLAGLVDVDRRCQAEFTRDFLACTAGQQAAVLRGLDAEVAALRTAKEDTGRLFWPMMKSLTLYGYFTSELVQTKVLKTPIIPGRFDGCVAF